MLKLVVERLHHHPIAVIKFPSLERMQQFAEMVRISQPTINDVIRFMEGVTFASECNSEILNQNAFYSGYECDTMVNNDFAYGPDVKVFFCTINYPGS